MHMEEKNMFVMELDYLIWEKLVAHRSVWAHRCATKHCPFKIYIS